MYFLETHLHTFGNSGCAKAPACLIAPFYKRKGYNGIVCTNHFNHFIFNRYFRGKNKDRKLARYLSGYQKLVKYCAPYGIDVYFGIELSLRGQEYKYTSPGIEILIYGISPEEFLEFNTSLYEMSPEELYKTACQRNWLLVQAHPYRNRTALYDPAYLHGLEVWNGHPGHDCRPEKCEARAKEFGLIGTGGSDFHNFSFAGSGILLKERPADLVSALKGDFQIVRRK